MITENRIEVGSEDLWQIICKNDMARVRMLRFDILCWYLLDKHTFQKLKKSISNEAQNGKLEIKRKQTKTPQISSGKFVFKITKNLF